MKAYFNRFISRYEKRCITFFLSIIVLILLLVSCKKTETASPQIYLTTSAGYVFKDSLMVVGTNFKVELNAVSGGDANITNIIIRNEHDDVMSNYFDTGINNEAIKISKILTKGGYNTEKWTFIAIDKKGGNASVSFIVTRDPTSQYGAIKHINATLGAQKSTLFGSFLSLNSGHCFFQDSAFLHQDSIEMLYYYDLIGTDANTIASPNANIDPSVYTGVTGLTNWTIKNRTDYYKTSLTYADFIAATNDSLLLVSYSNPNAKRKAKNLVTGDIYSFKTTSHNKYGLFYVQYVAGIDTGSVTVNILIQQ
jgi:hypothetical protein